MSLLLFYGIFPVGYLQAATGADLTVHVTHTSAFLQGQTNAVYLIRVRNAGDAASAGAITVAESMPSALTITAMSGPGWSCAAGVCTRNDSVAAGRMLPTIRVVATVAADAPASIGNTVTVSGGGDANSGNNLATDVTSIAAEGQMLGFGDLYSVGAGAPSDVPDIVAVATGSDLGLALRKDGSVLQWRWDGTVTTKVGSALTNVVAVATAYDWSYALKSDGTVTAWNQDTTSVAAAALTDVVALSAIQGVCLALKADGSVAALGTSTKQERTIPQGLADVVDVSVKSGHALALRADGSVVEWGSLAPATPPSLGPLEQALAVGPDASVGLRTDGSVVVWTASGTGPMLAVPPGLSGVTALAGDGYVMALRADGTLVAWGNSAGVVPQAAIALAQVRAVLGAPYYGVAIVPVRPVRLLIDSDSTGVNLKSWQTTQWPVITVDGVKINNFGGVLVMPASTHTVSTELVQPSYVAGTRYSFSSWSDGGASTHTVAVGNNDVSLMVHYTAQFHLSVESAPGLTVLPGSGYYDPGTSVMVRALESEGTQFSNFSVAAPNTLSRYDANNPIVVTMDGPRDVIAESANSYTSPLRPSLKLRRPLLQGQSNAMYVGRLVNRGTTTVTGAKVVFGGLVLSRLAGTGWACTPGICTRTDALAPGQAYPAILAVGGVAGNASGTVTESLSVGTSGLFDTALALSLVNGAGNAVTGWGDNSAGQAAAPGGLTNVVEVSGGGTHSVALRGDGTVTAWGDNSKQQMQVPGGLTEVVAVSAGGWHTLALTGTGGVVAWGDNSAGQSSVPAGLGVVIAVAAGANHSLALTSGGTVVAWGANGSGQTTVPASVVDAVAIAAGGDHSLAVLRNGTVVAWGSNGSGESTVPANLADVSEVMAGTDFSLALRVDGSVVAWGKSAAAPPQGLANVAWLTAGGGHALAQRLDGSVVAWGANGSGQTTVPGSLTQVTALGAGGAHSLAVASPAAVVHAAFATEPAGLAYVIDGVTYTEQQQFTWLYGSTHTVSVAAAQAGGTAGTQYAFRGWTGVAVTAGTVTVTQDLSATASFALQYLLTATATAGGSVTPATGYVDAGTAVTVQATASQGYAFNGFGGDLAGLQNPQSFTLTRPSTVSAAFVVPAAHAALSAGLRHSNLLLRGQTNAAYFLRVANLPTGGTTSGVVQATVTAPSGLQVTSMAGPGWSCLGATCSRSDALAGGASYPDITVIAAVDSNAPASVTLQAAVTGGGDAAAHAASDAAAVRSTSWPVSADAGIGVTDRAELPAGLSDVVAVSVGSGHIVALKKDGTVVAWGDDTYGQCDVPQGLTNVIAVLGVDTASAAIRADGHVVVWGFGQAVAGLPAGLSDAVALAGERQTMYAVRSDGSVTQWGGPSNAPPSALALVRNAVAVVASDGAIVMTAEGGVVQVGDYMGSPPPGVSGVVGVAVDGSRVLAVRPDGTVAVWSRKGIPLTPPDDWTDVASATLEDGCGIALTNSGTVRVWGCGDSAWIRVVANLSNVYALAVPLGTEAVLTAAPPDVSVTIGSAGGPVVVDGTEYGQSATFLWPYGSGHTIAVPSMVSTGAGVRRAFTRWSDDGAITHSYVAASVVWNEVNAEYRTQFQLSLTVTPAGSGTVRVSPTSTDGWYDGGERVELQAVAANGYSFLDYSGDVVSTWNPVSLAMDARKAVTAEFVAGSVAAKLLSFTPASGSGSTVMFQMAFAAASGDRALRFVQLLVASAPDGGGQPFCFLHYDVQGDAFWFYGDDGFFVGPVAPAVVSAGFQNSFCAVNTRATLSAGSADLLVLNETMVFKSNATRKVYLRMMSMNEQDSGWVQQGTWDAVAAEPIAMSAWPQPASGSQQTYQVQFHDPSLFEGTTFGWSQLLVAAATDGGGQPFCFVHYDKAGNGLWMYSSDAGFFLGPVAPGTASNTLNSSACSVDTAGVTVDRTLSNLTLAIPLTFKAPMAGQKSVFVRSLDPLIRDTGWVLQGTVTIP